MKSLVLTCTILMFLLLQGQAQTITQPITGIVFDKHSLEPLPFATVIVLNSQPLIGTTTDLEGNFRLKDVPVGRQTLQVSMMGYETYRLNELLINSGHNPTLELPLIPKPSVIDEAVVTVRKASPINTMSTLSSRQFTVEETQRYAGGLNDPARLATSFAGVASPSVSGNGISIRGNNPNGLLWQIQGVEVPNPNHFANLSVIGGGLLTAISNQMMANSDFHTGAFPAEYGNATSGVFDIKMRHGSTNKRHYTFQAGIIGVDFATEGPFVKGKKASYLLNYRNSTMALLAPILPANTGILKYQDLAFNTYFPTTNKGTFSFWGIGALDGQQMDALKMEDWTMLADRDNSKTKLFMYATGVSHRLRLGRKTLLNTTVATSGSGLNHREERMDYDLQTRPQSNIDNNRQRITFQSCINHQFSDQHRNRSGLKLHHLIYNVNIKQSLNEGESPVTLAKQSGSSELVQAYSQSHITLNSKLTLNAGINMLWFLLNDDISLEPRVGIQYQASKNQRISIAYGLHSRIEHLPLYFVEQQGSYPNKNLGLMRSAHYVLSYQRRLNEHLRVSIEPFYQHLTKVPVSPNSYLSSLNFNEEVFFHERLNNEGTGYNAGIDFTFERFLHKGFYYLFTGSVFEAKYTAADGIERNTRNNRNYVFNLLAGKEWNIGRDKNNLLSMNMRFNFMGGIRKDPIDTQASLQHQDIIYAETEGQRAFDEQFPNQSILSFTLSYRINKSNHASIVSIQILNALGTKEFSTDYYHLTKKTINTKYAGITVPEISYKIKF